MSRWVKKSKYENHEVIPGIGDILTVVWFAVGEGHAGRVFCNMDVGTEPPVFGDALKLAEDGGYKNGVILLIAESPLDGLVFEYGNHHDGLWHYHGETRGYA